MNKQKIFEVSKNYKEIEIYLRQQEIHKIMLVCGHSFFSLHVSNFFQKLPQNAGIEVVTFSEFSPNPLYESVVKGVEIFRREKCEAIFAVGGGSAIDVAKCIKLFSNMCISQNYLIQKVVPNQIELCVMPTTAGTGSEATQYAVIYYRGEKQSVSDISCIPSAVFFDSSVLESLPEYQRKSTMLDALCHAIESFWSVNSNEKSQKYSSEAIKLIFEFKKSYLANEEIGNRNMLRAANIAGKAINVTQTTAGHAMSYKLTSLYNIAHGHAAALCVKQVFSYMIENSDRCVDIRGKEYLNFVFEKISKSMGCKSARNAVEKFSELLDELRLSAPIAKESDYVVLKKSVNLERMKNNPVYLDEMAIDMLYHEILKGKK